VYDKIKNTLKKAGLESREKTIDAICDGIQIINKNFPLLITYGKDDPGFLKIIKVIYNKSFDWLEEGLYWLDGEGRVTTKTDHTEHLIKKIRKFRIYYELFRDEYYKDIVTKYRIDRQIVYQIDSYL
jgi:hypothetical protein